MLLGDSWMSLFFRDSRGEDLREGGSLELKEGKEQLWMLMNNVFVPFCCAAENPENCKVLKRGNDDPDMTT